MLSPPPSPFSKIWSSRPWAISVGGLLLHTLLGVSKTLTGLNGLADDVKPQALCLYSSSEPCCMALSAVGGVGHVTFCWVGALGRPWPKCCHTQICLIWSLNRSQAC